jgi:hypothetical protein
LDDRSMMCAGGREGEGVCLGDIGGPLFVAESEASDSVLVGVTSWVLETNRQVCANAGLPAVFAKVSTSVDWIQNTICSMTDTSPSFCQALVDGTACSGTCPECRNTATYWYTQGSMACGTEPCFTMGYACHDAEECSKCCNQYSWKDDENLTSCD